MWAKRQSGDRLSGQCSAWSTTGPGNTLCLIQGEDKKNKCVYVVKHLQPPNVMLRTVQDPERWDEKSLQAWGITMFENGRRGVEIALDVQQL